MIKMDVHDSSSFETDLLFVKEVFELENDQI